jgi:hypothetical protein
MFAKRLVIALAVLALTVPLNGCRGNRCCKSSSVSSAPPCCPSGPGLAPPTVLPPSGF